MTKTPFVVRSLLAAQVVQAFVGSGGTYVQGAYPAAQSAYLIRPYDFNGDSTMDLLVIRRDNATVAMLMAVFYNRSFTSSPTFTYGSVSPGATAVAAGHLNGDSALDVVVGECVSPLPCLTCVGARL